jgi:CTP synthase (UTP-ammonia lyase)
VLGSDRPVEAANRRKNAMMCDVEEAAVVNALEVASIYDIPYMLHSQDLDDYIVDHLRVDAGEMVWDGRSDLLDAVHNPSRE